ncbi:MAG: hypothetical protein JWO58_733 [Chitinophagaceae bacterium]|nr:hypothetical protein [Chitinophagaceae bacterium]
MKIHFFFFSLLAFFPLAVFSQDYFIVHANGKIVHPTTNKELQTGDALKQDDVLSFPGQKAWAILINTAGQQFFLQQESAGDSSQSVGLTAQAIEKTVYPVTRQSKAPVDNLRAYFAGAQFVFIGEEFYLEVDAKKYPLDEKLFLLYRYEYNGRTITHKIPQTKHVIHLSKPFLYEYKGDSISYLKTSNTEITIFNSLTNLPAHAASLRPIWLDEIQLKKELQLLQQVNSRQKLSKTELKKVFLQYVLDVYGKTDEIIFMNWVEEKVL